MEREHEIRLIAYTLWVQEGFSHGKAIEHWLRAEAIWDMYQKSLEASILKKQLFIKPVENIISV